MAQVKGRTLKGFASPLAMPLASRTGRPIASPLSGGVSGLLDFLPSAQRTGGMAVGTSRLFGSYSGALARLRRGSDSVEQDVGGGKGRITSDDVTEFVGKNLLGYSNDFTNAAWIKTDSTVTPNFDGTASKITQGASGTGEIALVVLHVSGRFYVSCQAIFKYSDNRWVRFRIASGSNAMNTWVDTQNGVFGTLLNSNSAAILSTSVDNLGNGFYRFKVSGWIDVSGNIVVNIFCVASDGSYPHISNGSYLLRDAQLEYGSTATTYEARTSTGASPCYVPALYDQIGSNNALQATGTRQPQIIPRQIGEMPILVGDGVDDFLNVSAVLSGINGKDFTLITVGKNTIAGNAGTPRLYFGTSKTSFVDYENLNHGNSGNRRVLSLVSTNLSQTAYVNGVSAATATVATVATWTSVDLYLGRFSASYANPSLGSILLQSALSPANRAAVEAALMTEYSITP